MNRLAARIAGLSRRLFRRGEATPAQRFLRREPRAGRLPVMRRQARLRRRESEPFRSKIELEHSYHLSPGLPRRAARVAQSISPISAQTSDPDFLESGAGPDDTA